MVLVGIMAVSVAPMMEWVARARDAALANEAARRLALARAEAGASGRTVGVRFDTGAQRIDLLHVPEPGATPTPLPDATGGSSGPATTGVGALFPGAAILSVDLDDAGSHDTVWFDFEGTPHLRDGAGARVDDLARDGTVTFSGGHTLVVRRVTGLVEGSET